MDRCAAHPCVDLAALHGLYAETYDALAAADDRSGVVDAARRAHRCSRVHPCCAIARALADVERGIEKRSALAFSACATCDGTVPRLE